MLIPGADAEKLTHSQCLGILECAEDTLDLLISNLSYLIYAENRNPIPDESLISKWELLRQKALDIQFDLPGSDLSTYKNIIKVNSQLCLELQPTIDLYMSKTLIKPL